MKEIEYICMVFNTKTGLHEKMGRPMCTKSLAEERAKEYAADKNKFVGYQLYDTRKLMFRKRIIETTYSEWLPVNPRLTKEEIRRYLETGLPLCAIVDFRKGQECDIFKTQEFVPGEVVVYIPDIYLNHIPVFDHGDEMTAEQIDEILSYCYTGDDFLKLVDGDMEKAKILFDYVDWQHPSSALDGDGLFDEEEE